MLGLWAVLLAGLAPAAEAPSWSALESAIEHAKQVLSDSSTASPTPAARPASSRPAGQGPGAAKSAEPFSLDDPKATPAVSLGDYKAMPSVVGIHVGMPVREAIATLRAQYKGAAQVGDPQQFAGFDQRVVLQMGAGIDVLGAPPETVYVEVTPPPQEQVIWRVYRRAGDFNHKSLHSQLLASLRQKYGKETVAFAASGLDGAESGREPHSDAEIGLLWWLFDEQGHPAPLPAGGIEQVRSNTCLGVFQDIPRSQSNYTKDAVMAQGYCTTSLVIVRADIGQEETVGAFYVDLLEVPVLARAARATLAMARAAALKEQQGELQKAKANTPAL